MTAVKSLLWMAAAVAALFYGLQFQKAREIEVLQKEYADLSARASELTQGTSLARAKLDQATGESTAGADFEARHNASLATIAAEQKKIDELQGKWPAVEADRAAAVTAVREKETTRPPTTVTLVDGTKLENFSVRSVPNEDTVSVEHSSGLVKLTTDKLPEDLKTRLGLGWKPDAPPVLTFDKDGNAVVKQAVKVNNEKDAAAATAAELGSAEVDSTTVSGVTRALAKVEALLAKTQVDFEAERANIRKLGIFKSNVIAPGGKTYGVLKKEANVRLAALAGRMQALRGEQANLKHKLKSF